MELEQADYESIEREAKGQLRTALIMQEVNEQILKIAQRWLKKHGKEKTGNDGSQGVQTGSVAKKGIKA